MNFLQHQICATEDLKCLLLLLIRKYNPLIQTKQYLQDLIVTNHNLLLLIDSIAKYPDAKETSLTDHIKQFATVEIMHQYGFLLSDFQENDKFVNDCLITMIHHIGGEQEQMTSLFQPIIVKTITQIWNSSYELCDVR